MDQHGLYEVVNVLFAIGGVCMLGSGLGKCYVLYKKQKNCLITQAVDFGLKHEPAWEDEEAEDEDDSVLKYFSKTGIELANKRFNKGRFNREIASLKAEEIKGGRIYEGSVPH